MNFLGKKLLNNFLNGIFLKKIILNNPLKWILSWNEWINYILNPYLLFFMKSPPFFCLFCTLGAIFGHYSLRPVSMIFWLLKWIIFWIESGDLSLNWILGKAIMNRILNESFFGKIQTLNWIRLVYRPPLLRGRHWSLVFLGW